MLTLAFLSLLDLLEHFEIYSASPLIPLAYPLLFVENTENMNANALHLVHAKKIPEDKHP